MPIQCVSNNFFPFDAKPTSIASTSSLVVAVVLAVLLGVACALQWGTPAIASLAVLTGVCLLIPVVISCCKKSDRDFVQRDDVPLSQRFPDAFVDNDVVAKPGDSLDTYLREMYYLVRKGDLDTFKQEIASRPSDTLYMYCFCMHTFEIDPDDETSTLPKEKRHQGQSLFDAILLQKDRANKENFLTALLTCIQDHQVEEHRKSIFSELLKIQTGTFINLCFDKLDLDHRTIEALLFQALKEGNTTWVEAYFQRWLKETLFQESIKIHDLCYGLMQSSLSVQQKRDFLTKVASLRAKTLDTFEVEGGRSFPAGIRTFTMSLLHLAIQSGNEEMVQFFAAYKQLVDKPALLGADKLTPLHLAIILGNLNMVKILLDAGADKTATLQSAEYLLKQFPSNPVTPKVLATQLGHLDIANLL